MNKYWIDMTVSKKEKQSNGSFRTYYKCGCPCCSSCWFSLDSESCIYSGPFKGYEYAGYEESTE